MLSIIESLLYLRIIQFCLDESRFHTCKLPRRGVMTVFVFGRIQNLYRIDAIDIDDDDLVFEHTQSYQS